MFSFLRGEPRTKHSQYRLSPSLFYSTINENNPNFLIIADSLMGSASEDEDEDESPHIRGPGLGLGSLGIGGNGPHSDGVLGPSDLSVQSISTDSIKTQHDDSDQVS